MSILDQTSQIAFKWKTLEQYTRPDGSPSYKAVAFAPFNRGFSKYPTDMFVWGGDEEESLIGRLTQLVADTVVTLEVKPKLKEGKADDGVFSSYFWNVVGYPDAKGVIPQDLLPIVKPQWAPNGNGWDERQQTIEVSWAINQAREVIQHFYGTKNGLPVDGYKDFLSRVERLTPDILDMKARILAYIQQPQEGTQDGQQAPSEPEGVVVGTIDGPNAFWASTVAAGWTSQQVHSACDGNVIKWLAARPGRTWADAHEHLIESGMGAKP